MIEAGARLFDRLIVVVGVNPHKKYTFTFAERLVMLSESARQFSNVAIDSFSKLYLINFAQSVSATHMIRGIPSEAAPIIAWPSTVSLYCTITFRKGMGR